MRRQRGQREKLFSFFWFWSVYAHTKKLTPSTEKQRISIIKQDYSRTSLNQKKKKKEEKKKKKNKSNPELRQ